MRITVTLQSPNNSFVLHANNARHIQAALYNAMDDPLAARVHNEGFRHGKRTMRLFVFSDLLAEKPPRKEQDGLRFEGKASLVIGSPVADVMKSLATNLLQSDYIRIGPERLNVCELAATEAPACEDVTVQTISPIVTYSTLMRPDGRKYTCYFQPGEQDFIRLIQTNLRRKYEVLYNAEPDDDVQVDVLRTGRMTLRKFKGTIIKGWHCTLRLRGQKELIQLAFNAGLGSKNSQGFGCVQIVK